MYILYYVPFPGPKKICEFSSNFKTVLLFSSSETLLSTCGWLQVVCEVGSRSFQFAKSVPLNKQAIA